MTALALVICLTPFPARADDTVYSEGPFYYTYADGSITIVGYFGRDKVVYVPASIAGYPVNRIGPGAFEGTGVEVIYLPDTIMEVSEGGTGSARVVYAGDSLPSPASDAPASEATEPPASAAAATPKPTEKPTQAPSDGIATHGDGGEETTVDGDLIPEVTGAPTPEPEATPAPAATATAAASAAPETEAPQGSPSAEPVQEPAQKQHGAGWYAAIIGGILAAAGLALIVMAKRKRK